MKRPTPFTRRPGAFTRRSRPSARKFRAFTLLELLTAMAIVMMLMAILLPSASHSRERAKRTVCGTNLRGIGHGLYLYANEDPYGFPVIGPTDLENTGQMRLFHLQDRTGIPVTTGIPSPTVDMWAMVRPSFSLPRQFICPSTTDQPDPAVDLTAYYDFLSSQNLSYAYQYQHDPHRRVIGPSSEPEFPGMADGNPNNKGGVSGSIQQDRLSIWAGNSVNHTDRDGQNVLFQDGHVVFEKGPDVGFSGRTDIPQVSRGRDNIYTWFVSSSNAMVDPGSAAPNPNLCNPGSRSDACLVP